MGSLLIRTPTQADADVMGRVHVRAWQAAYRGVMPDEYLDGLRPEDRAEVWRRAMGATHGAQGLLVAEVDGDVVGFAAFGREAEASGEDDTTVGELYAINIDPDHWGRGIGQSLLTAVTERLRGAGFRSAVLWVVPSNQRAGSLYEREGWSADGRSRRDEVLGVDVDELRYARAL